MRRYPFVPTLAAAFVVGPLLLTGCSEGTSPYVDEAAEATEGTGEFPDGAVNRSLDPGDAGTVGPANLDGEPDGDEAGATTEGMNTEGANAEGMNETAPAGPPVTAKPVSYEELRSLIEAADGPVLVDMWADWCAPCREAFPHTVALAREHKEDGLTVISLAFNSEKDLDAVQSFLTEVGAGELTNVYTEDGGESEQWDPLAGPDGLPLPTLLVFNADGEEVARIIGGGEGPRAELDAAVADALGG
ncbi:TlpA family protein disulfide reductase [Alienimonas californiensis]|uniref:Thiol-disulfide oxidoreductase ResA n=1 Tax=Alienimonas californiensis TaxID=2527989 RepID=A0A517P604_9PLAN|nr:TlpA disulfide reductase family protein [Alienimonas californiensis]QDT14809.1 Thiol-disulfide oxidoreductase ResA [Alienimonas californiensis]